MYHAAEFHVVQARVHTTRGSVHATLSAGRVAILLVVLLCSSAITFAQFEGKLTAFDAAAGDWFGHSVSLDGDTAVVGAYQDDDDGADSGSAYVFTRTAGVWSQQAKLTASDAAAEDRFGNAVAVDGDTAVVGAETDDDAGLSSGSAYVFTRTAGVWTEQAKLTASDGASSESFGGCVSISGDTAVVGAFDHGNGEAPFDSGAAYVFTRTAGVWTEQVKLTASVAAADAWFGRSVAIDGETAVVGADGDDDSGSAYVFTRTAGVWTEQAKLTASDAAGGDWIGHSVSLDGDTAVVGAPMDDDAGSRSGSAYVFTRTAGVWTEQAKLTAPDAAAGDRFGHSVSLDGDTAVVGAHMDDDAGSRSGSAYVFTRTAGVWTEQAKLTAPDAAADDRFGIAVALDVDTAVVGAYFDDDGGDASGSAYVFGGGPVPVQLQSFVVD